MSLNQLLATLCDLVGTRLEPVYADLRPGDVRDSQADISKAERLLGDRPSSDCVMASKRTLVPRRARPQRA